MTGILQSDMTGGMRKLASLLGVEPQHDVDGRVLGDDQLRAALEALGWSADDSSDLRSHIDAVTEQQWSTVLPPIVIATAGEPIQIPVRTADAGSVSLGVCGFGSGRCGADGADGGGDPIPVQGRITGTQTVTVGGKSDVRHEYTIEGPALGAGLYQVRCESPLGRETAPLAVAQPVESGEAAAAKSFHFYLAAARMGGSWGVGDFADLKDIAVIAARAGADRLVLAPVMASCSEDPFDVESLCALDPVYISITQTIEFGTAPAAAREAVRSLGVDLIESSSFNRPLEVAEVRQRKIQALRILYEVPARISRQAELEAFTESCGDSIRAWALYKAMQMEGPVRSSFDSDATRTFRDRRSDVVEFWMWVQYVAREQFAAAVRAAESLGYELRVAVELPDAGVVEEWAHPELVLGADGGPRLRTVLPNAQQVAHVTGLLRDTAALVAGADVHVSPRFSRFPAGTYEVPVVKPLLPAVISSHLSTRGSHVIGSDCTVGLADIMGDPRPQDSMPWRMPICNDKLEPMTSVSLDERLREWAQSGATM